MHLEIIYGPMFSGKTTTLYQKITQYLDVKKLQTGNEPKAVIINHSSDSRDKFSGNLSTHSTFLKESSNNIEYVSLEYLTYNDAYFEDVDIIGVDESQFFDDLEKFIKLFLKTNIKIICSGLISDIYKNKFGQLLDLFPLADSIIHKKAFCIKCKNLDYPNACFTKLKDNIKEPIVSGSKHYIPVCGYHYSHTGM